MPYLNLLAIILLSQPLYAAIYGDDDRYELDDLPLTSHERKSAEAVATLALQKHLKKDHLGYFLDFQTLDESSAAIEEPLCEEERFRQQKASFNRVGTGFLVAPDILVTAGHAIKDEMGCAERVIIFGRQGPLNQNDEIAEDDIYYCSELITSQQQENPLIDFAIIRLDRPVKGRRPLAIRRSGVINPQDHLSMIGHPLGLPLKITLNGQLHNNNHEYHFSAFLDTFPGNSGSPVINSRTGLVEGILVEGEVGDTTIRGEWPEGCWYSKVYCHQDLNFGGVCDDITKEGAKITRSSTFLPYLPE